MNLILEVLKDTFTDRARKKISQQEVIIYCNNLAEIIQQNYQPDIVIAIDTGGSFPGKLIAKALKVPIIHVTIHRNINIGRMYNLDPIPIRWIISFYHHFLFHTKKPIVVTKIDTNISGKNILIVDDVLHTGATIDVATKYLRNVSVSQIKTASLSYVSKRKPDFSVLPVGNYSFPWSKDFTDS